MTLRALERQADRMQRRRPYIARPGHDLRRRVETLRAHSFVQSVLGHRSAAFTLTVYGHLFDADLDDLAAKLDADLSRTSVATLERDAV
jgi:integrase